jgi:hypothetical protein
MSPHQFLSRFRMLHELAKSGTINRADRDEYERARVEFATLIVTTQELNVPKGGERNAFRIAYMIKVEIEYAGLTQSASTLDVGEGGFAALLHPPPPVGAVSNFKLFLPGGDGKGITGKVKCTGHQKQGGVVRAGFAFTEIEPAAKERLAFIVFDQVLAKIPTKP